MEKTYLSVREAAEYMGYSVGYIYKLVSANVLPHYTPNGGRIMFKVKELDEWISNGRKQGNTPDPKPNILLLGKTKPSNERIKTQF